MSEVSALYPGRFTSPSGSSAGRKAIGSQADDRQIASVQSHSSATVGQQPIAAERGSLMTIDVDEELSKLSDAPRMPRAMTRRELFADLLFVFLQIASRFIFLLAGIAGFVWKGFAGAAVLAVAGYLLGWWMRRSLGKRGRDPNTGFFVRMSERARGSRRGVLEWAIEKTRGTEFTREKCAAICSAYENAAATLRGPVDAATEKRVLSELDEAVKRISYG